MKTAIRVLALLSLLLVATAIPAWAGQSIGSSPYAADLLVSGLNTGSLAPGEEYWYAYSRLDLGDADYNSIVLSLNFEAEGRAVASRVNFQVFNFNQVDAWLKDSSGPVDSLGLGTPASADFDAVTGERLWAGPVAPREVYYVRIFNLSPSPVKFRLTALGQRNGQLEAFFDVEGDPSAGEQPEVIPAAMSVSPEGKPSVPDRGSILADLPVQPDANSPASTRWLLAAQAINGLSPQDAAAWLMAAATLGWLPGSSSSAGLVPVDPNGGSLPPAGGDGGEGGAARGEIASVPVPPDPNNGQSIYPNRPLELLDGSNIGRLGPEAEHWYTFHRGDLDEEIIENMSLTMFFTPGEPNIARHVTFEMFTGSQYQIWERGTPENMEHFGAGSWVSRDTDYNSGERLWHGSVVDQDQYFVKVTNGTERWIDYHLITGDITNIEMGPKSESSLEPIPAVLNKRPTGKDIGSPLAVSKGQTAGHLAAGEDIWFAFENNTGQPNVPQLQNYIVKLIHTPGAGFVTNYVNVEIYPYQEQAIWRRGDTNKIKPFGAGSDLSYDKETDAHTWVWDGHLISDTVYFVRIRNDSPRAIDYKLLIQPTGLSTTLE